jgi:hypothetical protein
MVEMVVLVVAVASTHHKMGVLGLLVKETMVLLVGQAVAGVAVGVLVQ